MTGLQRLLKFIPTFLTALVLAMAVWISAVTSTDPTEERQYSEPIPIEVIGLDPGLMITNEPADQLNVVLSAPRSIWNQLTADPSTIRAVIDLSGLEPGSHSVPVQVQVSLRPVQIVSRAPRAVTVALERLSTRTVPISLVTRGDPAIGYQAGLPTLSQTSTIVSGPASVVERVQKVEALLDLTQVFETLNRTLTLQAVDANESPVNGLTLTPDRVTVTLPINQKGGYRNVVVKVVTSGEITKGYRLTNISVFPPAVTVFSSDPTAITNLPGFVETMPLDLANAKDDLDIALTLNLPAGVSVVGDQTVLVRVGIAAIQSSLPLSNQKINIIGLAPNLKATLSPETIDLILSGPLPLLDALKQGDVTISLDVSGLLRGTYQLEPKIEVAISEIIVESILPGTIQVTISTAPTPTPQR
ncbi:MAG TPA: CdaR family protein [Longilinea sp.]|nr:CdaR family protein [Longilinea sp.]